MDGVTTATLASTAVADNIADIAGASGVAIATVMGIDLNTGIPTIIRNRSTFRRRCITNRGNRRALVYFFRLIFVGSELQ